MAQPSESPWCPDQALLALSQLNGLIKVTAVQPVLHATYQ
jgi:hypothetical protein